MFFDGLERVGLHAPLLDELAIRHLER